MGDLQITFMELADEESKLRSCCSMVNIWSISPLWFLFLLPFLLLLPHPNLIFDILLPLFSVSLIKQHCSTGIFYLKPELSVRHGHWSSFPLSSTMISAENDRSIYVYIFDRQTKFRKGPSKQEAQPEYIGKWIKVYLLNM